jgi:transposase-like protein
MKKRFTEAQIIGFLKEAQAGVPVKDLCRKHGFSDAAFYGWRAKFGGMQVDDAKRLRHWRRRTPSSRSCSRRQCSMPKRYAALRGKY